MPIRMNAGLKSVGIDPDIVQKLMDAQKIPVEAAKNRKEKVNVEKKEFEKLAGLLGGLDATLSGLRTKHDFYKLKLDSSNPDIIDGTVGPGALLGTYEFEVRSLARIEKELAYGFPDKDKTAVGFGFMSVERDGLDPAEIVIEPGATLQDVATQINDAKAGVRAMVINTKYKPDSFRLLVVSEKSGQEAKVFIDEDTTFLEFKNQVAGRNLDVLFEDVPITSEDNTITDLLEAVTLQCRRSEPGTRVEVSVLHDAEATLAGIKAFVDKYNEVAKFVNQQFVKDGDSGKYGILSGDSSVRTIIRQLQSSFGYVPNADGKYRSIAEIGISTEAKTGYLQLDEAKVKAALADDYDSVASLFIRSDDSNGIAGLLSDKLKGFRDPGSGVIKSRLRGLQRILDTQDQEIERKQRYLTSQEENLTRRFTALEGTLAGLQSQGNFLKARMAAGE